VAWLLHRHVRQPEEVAVLINVVREPLRTCRVCAARVRGFRFCWRCAAHQRITGVADVVAPLVYAVADAESAEVLGRYKNHPVRTERARCAITITYLLCNAIVLHEQCFGAETGLPDSLRTVIPSLTSRPGVHPLTSVVEEIGVVVDPIVAPGADPRCDRAVRVGKFVVEPPECVGGRHVLVLMRPDPTPSSRPGPCARLVLRRSACLSSADGSARETH
jgi:hypothetical protein